MSTDHKATAERAIDLASAGARAINQEAASAVGIDPMVALLRSMDVQTTVLMAQTYAMLAIVDKIDDLIRSCNAHSV